MTGTISNGSRASSPSMAELKLKAERGEPYCEPSGTSSRRKNTPVGFEASSWVAMIASSFWVPFSVLV